jgi:DNA-binding NarL/FixJ family response regulator
LGKQRIVIAEDYTILREGLRALLSLDPDLEIVGEAEDVTVHKTEEYILETLKAGADGYVLKDDTHAELTMAIKSVLAGRPYLSPGVSEKVIGGYLEGKKTLKPASPWETLTQREREVLKLIGEGYKNKEIADELCISAKTVEKHRANVMEKLDLHSASALTAFAMEKGLITR